jgi:hypothetical protein
VAHVDATSNRAAVVAVANGESDVVMRCSLCAQKLAFSERAL